MELRKSGMMPFEPPLLSALAAPALPHDIAFHSRLVRFQPAAPGASTAVVVEVPVADLEFKEDEMKHFNARLSLVALVKDANGTVVQKFTRDLPIQSTPENLAAMKMGNFVYKDSLTLAPGKYSLETAVMDRENNKIGAARESFELAAPKGVAISGISLVRSYAAGAKDLDPSDPFVFQGGRVTPTLSSTVQGTKGSTLSMFFVVYPEAGNSAKPMVELEYIKDGKVVGKGGLELPAADKQGRIPYIMSSSAEAMPPGEYVIQATVKQGASSAQEKTSFKVEK